MTPSPSQPKRILTLLGLKIRSSILQTNESTKNKNRLKNFSLAMYLVLKNITDIEIRVTVIKNSADTKSKIKTIKILALPV